MKEDFVYIDRELEERIKRLVKKKEIIAVVGPRQSGKTTLVKHIFKNLKKSLVVDFGDREKLSLFENDINSFIELYVKGYQFLFIDEFQYVKDGGKNLKYIYDNCSIKILISGSSVSELSIQSIKYLVGRIFVFTLYPLSFSEFMRYKNEKLFNMLQKNKTLSMDIINSVNKYYQEFLIYGGYPRVVVSNSREEKEIVLKNIYNTYLLKEIKEILGIKDDYLISKIISLLALQIGSLVNYNELMNSSGTNYKEIVSNLNILKKTFVIGECRPFYTNKRLELSKNPKFFFIDNGFRNMAIGNFQELKKRTDIGMLNENFVFAELNKKEILLKYWRTKSKAEIDFIVEIEGKILPIEVRSFLSGEKIGRAIYSFTEKYKIKEAYILSENIDKKLKVRFGAVNFKPLFAIDFLF